MLLRIPQNQILVSVSLVITRAGVFCTPAKAWQTQVPSNELKHSSKSPLGETVCVQRCLSFILPIIRRNAFQLDKSLKNVETTFLIKLWWNRCQNLKLNFTYWNAGNFNYANKNLKRPKGWYMGNSVHIQVKLIKKSTFANYYTLHSAFNWFWHFDINFVYEQTGCVKPSLKKYRVKRYQ